MVRPHPANAHRQLRQRNRRNQERQSQSQYQGRANHNLHSLQTGPASCKEIPIMGRLVLVGQPNGVQTITKVFCAGADECSMSLADGVNQQPTLLAMRSSAFARPDDWKKEGMSRMSKT